MHEFISRKNKKLRADLEVKIKAVRQTLAPLPSPTAAVEDPECWSRLPVIIQLTQRPPLAGLDHSCSVGLALVKLGALIPAKYFLIS